MYGYSFLAGLASGLPLFLSPATNYRMGSYVFELENRVLGTVSSLSVWATTIAMLGLIFFLLNMVLREFKGWNDLPQPEVLKINACFGLGMAVSVLLFVAIMARG